jgi:hypothetical protein
MATNPKLLMHGTSSSPTRIGEARSGACKASKSCEKVKSYRGLISIKAVTKVG